MPWGENHKLTDTHSTAHSTQDERNGNEICLCLTSLSRFLSQIHLASDKHNTTTHIWPTSTEAHAREYFMFYFLIFLVVTCDFRLPRPSLAIGPTLALSRCHSITKLFGELNSVAAHHVELIVIIHNSDFPLKMICGRCVPTASRIGSWQNVFGLFVVERLSLSIFRTIFTSQFAHVLCPALTHVN